MATRSPVEDKQKLPIDVISSSEPLGFMKFSGDDYCRGFGVAGNREVCMGGKKTVGGRTAESERWMMREPSSTSSGSDGPRSSSKACRRSVPGNKRGKFLRARGGGYVGRNSPRSKEAKNPVKVKPPLLERDTILTEFDLQVIGDKFNLEDGIVFAVPAKGHRLAEPPTGFFTVYVAHLSAGLTIPPHPLLIEICTDNGISMAQLTPSAILFFRGFCHRVEEIGLPLSVELFYALFSLMRKNREFFYFCPRANCKFLIRSSTSWEDWTERFFYVRDDNWGIPVTWRKNKVCNTLKTIDMRKLQKQCADSGLFDSMFDPLELALDGGKIDFASIRAKKQKQETESRPTRVDTLKVGDDDDDDDDGLQRRNNCFEEEVIQGLEKRPGGESSACTRGGKGLFLSEVNGVETLWDPSDDDFAVARTRAVSTEYDMCRLSKKPIDQLIAAIHANSARSITLADLVSMHVEEAKGALLKVKAEYIQLNSQYIDMCNRCTEQSTQISLLKANLEKERMEWKASYEQLEAKYHQAKEKAEEGAVKRVEDTATYRDVVLLCRKQMRETLNG
ncbi:hypothetical protein ABFS82_11G116200 [Erythranthe guttata]